MKLCKCELIIFFVSGKDAKVYNGVVFSWGNFHGEIVGHIFLNLDQK